MINDKMAEGIYAKSTPTAQNVSTTQSASTPVVAQGSDISTAAIISLVSGVFGLFFAPLAIIAIILGHVSRSSIANSNGNLTGAGLGLAGLLLGYISIVMVVIAMMSFGSSIMGFASMLIR